MSQSAERKIKLLVLYDLLVKYTDEEHPMTTVEIAEKLQEFGIATTLQTIYEDIEVLCRYGYEVICTTGKNNKYFVADRKFERPEIQVLLNAVGAANFLTEKKTTVLAQKVSELLGIPQGEQVKGILSDSRVKCGNEHIYYSIDAITTAILEKKKVTFRYFDYNARAERVYRKDGARYEVNPLGMVYTGDNFYLVCFHDKYGNPANYRIDRTTDTQVEDSAMTRLKEYENFDLTAYKRELFAMYAGEPTHITLLFPHTFMDVMIDRFGTDIAPVCNGNDEYLLHTTVRVSKTFFAWLTTFEGDIKIETPIEVKARYKEFLINILDRI